MSVSFAEPRIDVARERVERCAAWLDKNKPGWADQMNLRRFDIFKGSECVIGQLYGDWDNMPLALQGKGLYFGRSLCRTVHFGLNATTFDPARVRYVDLQHEWERVIRARQTAKPKPKGWLNAIVSLIRR